jgi:hypothetical protein
LQNNRQFRARAGRPGSKNDNTKCDGAPGTGQVVTKFAYLRAAQAYMLISMPTGTSTIFGVFQVIRELQARGTVAASIF